MRHLIKKGFGCFALLVAVSAVSAEQQSNSHWNAGAVSMTTYKDNWSPVVLPWLSYHNDYLSINPMQIALVGERGGLQWQAGLGLDYNELFDDTKRGFLAQLNTQYYWGPIRFTAKISNRLSDFTTAWQSAATAGSQFPLGQGMFGAEFGVAAESAQWQSDLNADDLHLAPTAAIQYVHEFGAWQAMAVAKYQSASVTSEDTAEQTYSLFIMKSW